MRRSRIGRMVRIAATGIFLALVLYGNALAQKDRVLTAACPSRNSEAVTAVFNSGGKTLYLPGFWDLSAVTLELEDSRVIYLGPGRTEITAGQPADLSGLTGKRLAVLDERKKKAGNITILQGSEIPSLFLEADAGEWKRIKKDREHEITSGRAVFFEGDGQVSYSGGLEQLKCRGNDSFTYPKKPYQFKLQEKASLCGMNKAKTWILLNNWPDISLLRNQIVLDLSREIGLRYAVGCEQTDVWINGSYQGLYLLAEKVQIKKGRIEITNLEEATEAVNSSPLDPGPMEKKKREGFNFVHSYPSVNDPEDITGGFIATIEKNYRMRKNELPGFETIHMLSIRIKEPTYPSTAQTAYLGRLISEMESALLAEDGVAPETGKSYEEYLDTESFARKFLIEDWCKNYDFIGGSQYLYKDSDRIDPLIYAGPAWDYDLSFGNMPDRGYLPTGSYIINFKQKNNIYWLLYSHDAFRNRLSEIWQDSFRQSMSVLLGETPAQPGGIVRPFDEYRARIEASAAMNFRKWSVDKKFEETDSGRNFNNAVRYLKKWITAHTAAMDRLFGPDTATER